MIAEYHVLYSLGEPRRWVPVRGARLFWGRHFAGQGNKSRKCQSACRLQKPRRKVGYHLRRHRISQLLRLAMHPAVFLSWEGIGLNPARRTSPTPLHAGAELKTGRHPDSYRWVSTVAVTLSVHTPPGDLGVRNATAWVTPGKRGAPSCQRVRVSEIGV